MDAGSELAGLASAAAAQIVSRLASDGWDAVKAGVLSLWRRSHPGRVGRDLEQARAELLAARQSGGEQDLARLLVTEWDARLARLLAAQPDAAGELRALIRSDFRPAGQAAGSVTVDVHVTGGGHGYAAGHDMFINGREPA
jgi:hypothetical protein